MANLTRLGDLERAVMNQLWAASEPQTVRQVHEVLVTERDLAYTTVMTVLQRLAKRAWWRSCAMTAPTATPRCAAVTNWSPG